MIEFIPEFLRAMRFEKLSSDQQKEKSNRFLINALDHARRTTRFYQDWQGDLSSLPFTTRSDLQEQRDAFISCSPRGAGVWRSTSGSSGKIVHVYWDHHNLWQRFIFMYRAFAMIGLTPLKKVMYALPDREDTGESRILFRNEHLSLRDPVEVNIAKIKAFRPHVLSIYPSYALDIGAAAGGQLNFLQALSLNSENILAHHYQKVQQYFACEAYAEYSTVELGVIAAMCRFRKMHLFTDNVHIEVIDELGQNVEGERTGELVATTLQNHGFPLVRYRTGDLGAIDSVHQCLCGRKTPILKHLHGRQDDYLITSHGKKIPAWKIYEAVERPAPKDYIFKDIFISQCRPGSFDFYFTPDRDYHPSLHQRIQENIDALFDERVQINFNPTVSIPRPDTLKRKYIQRAFDRE